MPRDPERLFRQLQHQAVLTGELENRPVGVRPEPVVAALAFLDLYWKHKGHPLADGYLEQVDRHLRDALNAEPREDA